MSDSKSILIIGNEARVRGLISRLFSEADSKVLTVADGSSGIRATLDHKIDLVLLDANAPDVRALEVVNAIKAHAPICP